MEKQYDAKIYPGQTINTINSFEVETKNFNKMVVLQIEDIKKKLGLNPTDELYTYTEKNIIDDDLKITLCKTWDDLVGTFYSCYNAENENDKFWGIAEIDRYSDNNIKRKSNIASYLGIGPEWCDNNKFSYMLVSMDYTVGCYNLKSDKEQDIKNELKKTIEQVLSPQTTNEDLFKNKQNVLNEIINVTGTHLIRSINVGERVFQVFVYKQETFDSILKSSSGADPSSFQYFTTKSENLCQCSGQVRTFSKSDIFGKKNHLLKDEKYSHYDSIFMIPDQEELLDCLKEGTIVAPLSIQMTSSIVPSGSIAVNLLKETSMQARVARFGVECFGAAYCNNENTIDYATLYGAFCDQHTLAEIWGPCHSISQLYVNLNEILKFENVANLSNVKHLIVTADVIEIENDLDLSNIENLILGCRLLIAGKNGSVPNIKLSSNVFDCRKNYMYCDEMKGNCAFYVNGEADKRFLVYGNIASTLVLKKNISQSGAQEETVEYEDFFAGKFPIDVFYQEKKDDAQTSIDVNSWIKETLETGIQILLSSASVPVSVNYIDNSVNKKDDKVEVSAKDIATEAYKCIKWITIYTSKIVKRDLEKVPSAISSLYASALQVMDRSVDPSKNPSEFKANVPLLSFETYNNAVNNFLRAAEDYSIQYNTIQKNIKDNMRDFRNQKNIIKIADFLIDQNEAFAENEQSIASGHQEIINQKNDSLKQLQNQEKNLLEECTQKQKELEIAKDQLQKAYTDKKKLEEKKAYWDLALNLVGCLGSALGVAPAVAKIPETAKDIDKFIQIASAFKQSVSYIEELIKTVIKADAIVSYGENKKKLNIEKIDVPSDLQWDEFYNNAEREINNLKEGGYCATEVNNYNAKLKNLVAVGKCYNNIQEQIRQINYDIFTEKINEKIAIENSDRLKNLKSKIANNQFSPDSDYDSDLGKFDVVLRQKLNNVLLKLIEIARLQNDSITYFYQTSPCPINHFSIIDVKEMLAKQESDAIKFLDGHGTITEMGEPIKIKLENVPIDQLKGQGYEFSINLDQISNRYARVRFNYIEIRVNGVKTDTGECHVKLVSLGDPMYDRSADKDGHRLLYKTIKKDWNTVYNITTNKTTISTKPAPDFNNKYTKLTPFQTFRIYVPDETNIKDAENQNITFEKDCTDITIDFCDVEVIYVETPKIEKISQKFGCCNSEDFLHDLYNGEKSISNGWDAVSFITIKAFNDLWKKRWDDDTYKYSEDVLQKKDINITSKKGDKETNINVHIELGAPLFVLNEIKATAIADIKIPFKKATIQKFENGEKKKDLVYESKEDEIFYLMTNISVNRFRGLVDNDGKVSICVVKEEFQENPVEIDSQMDVDFKKVVVDEIKKNGLEPWFVRKISYKNEEEYLKPKQFFLSTYHEKEPAVLGVFILTTTKWNVDLNKKNSWNDNAWVVGDGCDTATYFSDSMFWDNNVAPSMSRIGKILEVDHKIHEPHRWFVDLYERPVAKIHYGNKLITHEITGLDPGTILFTLQSNVFVFYCGQSCGIEKNYPYKTPLGVADGDLSFSFCFLMNAVPSINSETFELSIPFELIKEPTIKAESLSKSILYHAFTQEAVEAFAYFLSRLQKCQLKTMPMRVISNILFPEGTWTPQKVAIPNDIAIAGVIKKDPPPST